MQSWKEWIANSYLMEKLMDIQLLTAYTLTIGNMIKNGR